MNNISINTDSFGRKFLKCVNRFRILIILCCLVILMSFASEFFLTKNNIVSLLRSMSAYGILAIGLTFILITGNLDVSMGSVLALCTVFFGKCIPVMGFLPACLFTIVFGAALSAFTGIWISYFKLNAFVVTMCMQMAYKGIALVWTGSTTLRISDNTMTAFGSKNLFGYIPVIFIVFVIVAIVAEIILRQTVFGRNVFLLGGDKKVAEYQGISVWKHIWGCFIIAGACAGIAAVVYCSRVLSASGNFGSGDATMAIVPIAIIGGTTLRGGEGGALKTLLGALMLYTIYNAMAMFDIYIYMQDFIKGLILLVIIVGDKYFMNRTKKV